MNIQISGPARPKLWPPKALLSGPFERRLPPLSGTEPRRIAGEVPE
ncbi:MAG TPA: hypothetical protein VGW40_04895 [Allosphingosinicella sp.]|nr:hypothetical protein [Allosphingosinicella sp.]